MSAVTTVKIWTESQSKRRENAPRKAPESEPKPAPSMKIPTEFAAPSLIRSVMIPPTVPEENFNAPV